MKLGSRVRIDHNGYIDYGIVIRITESSICVRVFCTYTDMHHREIMDIIAHGEYDYNHKDVVEI